MKLSVIVNEIINNENVANAFFNGWNRWQDEKDCEDINDYAQVLMSIIKNEFPQYDMNLVGGSKRPFGIKIMLYCYKMHIFVKVKNGCLVLSMAMCK